MWLPNIGKTPKGKETAREAVGVGIFHELRQRRKSLETLKRRERQREEKPGKSHFLGKQQGEYLKDQARSKRS
jgi:hypothetical protein